jgi:hypothetical protein
MFGCISFDFPISALNPTLVRNWNHINYQRNEDHQEVTHFHLEKLLKLVSSRVIKLAPPKAN